MKIIFGALIVMGLLVGAYFVFAHAADNNTKTEETMNFELIQSDVANGGLLIDVRTPEEYAESHIDGAINIPLNLLQSGTQPSASKDAKLYVYCRSGNRSATAANILKGVGFTNIKDLGAMTSVEALGGKIVN